MGEKLILVSLEGFRVGLVYFIVIFFCLLQQLLEGRLLQDRYNVAFLKLVTGLNGNLLD
mgnify:CR=1 FL=1